jgi:hypothetical protein
MLLIETKHPPRLLSLIAALSRHGAWPLSASRSSTSTSTSLLLPVPALVPALHHTSYIIFGTMPCHVSRVTVALEHRPRRGCGMRSVGPAYTATRPCAVCSVCTVHRLSQAQGTAARPRSRSSILDPGSPERREASDCLSGRDRDARHVHTAYSKQRDTSPRAPVLRSGPRPRRLAVARRVEPNTLRTLIRSI